MKKLHAGNIELLHDRYVPAEGLIREESSRKKLIKNLGIRVTHQLMVRQREMMANELKQYYAGKGLLVEVELNGPDKTCINFFSALFCENAVHRIVKKTNLFFYLKEAGFEKVTLDDSDENVWVYNLSLVTGLEAKR